MGLTGSVSEGGKNLWMDVQDGERSDPGRSSLTKHFNIVVETVVRAVLLKVFGKQEAHNGLSWFTGEHNIVSYEGDSSIEGCNPIWVQTTLTMVVRIFDGVGL